MVKFFVIWLDKSLWACSNTTFYVIWPCSFWKAWQNLIQQVFLYMCDLKFVYIQNITKQYFYNPSYVSIFISAAEANIIGFLLWKLFFLWNLATKISSKIKGRCRNLKEHCVFESFERVDTPKKIALWKSEVGKHGKASDFSGPAYCCWDSRVLLTS